MLTVDRCKKLMRDVGMPESQSLMAALFQANMEGHLYGRAEERARIRALVQAMRDEWLRDYERNLSAGLSRDVSVETLVFLFHEEVMALIDKEETSHESL